MSVSRHRDDDEASEETGKEGVGRSYMGREGGSVGWGSEVDKEREKVRLPPLRSSGTFMSDWRPGIQCAVPERPLPAACPALKVFRESPVAVMGFRAVLLSFLLVSLSWSRGAVITGVSERFPALLHTVKSFLFHCFNQIY